MIQRSTVTFKKVLHDIWTSPSFSYCSPRVKKVSVEVQVNLDSSSVTNSPTLEQQFKETLQSNSRLSEELSVARKEIEQLSARLKEYEVSLKPSSA